jgi:hypothetical protein
MTADELEEILDLIADRAPALQGHVSKLKIGEIEIELRAAEPPQPSEADLARQAQLDKAMAERDRAPVDPLDDPMTFPGGRVPRLPDRQREQPRDEHDDDDE